ncbi:MAG: hypothetical protein ABI661_10310 [Gammaproteobacteria bacterium]
MKKLSSTAIITSGFRGFLCAGLSTVITAFFSWSFISSTASMDWMGSSALDQTEIQA